MQYPEGFDAPPEYDEDGVLINEHPNDPNWDPNWHPSPDTGGGYVSPRVSTAPKVPDRPMCSYDLAKIAGRSVSGQQWADYCYRERQRKELGLTPQYLMPKPLKYYPVNPKPVTTKVVVGNIFGYAIGYVGVALIALVVICFAVLGWEFIHYVVTSINWGACHGKCNY